MKITNKYNLIVLVTVVVVVGASLSFASTAFATYAGTTNVCTANSCVEFVKPAITVGDLRFSVVSSGLAGDSNYNVLYNIQNVSAAPVTIGYQTWTCRCSEHIGNPVDAGYGHVVCDAFYPTTTPPWGCQKVNHTDTLAVNESKNIPVSVSQYNNQMCGSYQTDINLTSLNGNPIGSPLIYTSTSLVLSNNDCPLTSTPATIVCSTNSQCGTNGFIGSPFCQGNSIYQNYTTYTCNNPGTTTSSCSNVTVPQLQSNCSSNQTCFNGQCNANAVVTTTPASTQTQTQTQNNNQTVYVNTPTAHTPVYIANPNYNNNYNNNSCVNFSYKQCVGNNIYWYNSCGQQTDLYQTCYGSNTCQGGACVMTQPVYYPTYPTYPNYISHYRTSCYGNNVYWYDSVGAVNSVYKNCIDANSCTIDACSGSACTNTLRCDGTTCAMNSTDYNTYCQNASNVGSSNMLFSLFAKKDPISVQWDKSVEIKSNETTYFLMTVENNSQENIQNVRVSANIPLEITTLGNLKVNDASVSGDIVSGIDVGPLAPGVLKKITFEGKSGTITSVSTKQVNAKVEFNGISQPDSLSVNFSTGAVAGALTEAKSSIWIIDFLKHWYLWILGFLVLIFLFVVIFRRLSSNS